MTTTTAPPGYTPVGTVTPGKPLKWSARGDLKESTVAHLVPSDNLSLITEKTSPTTTLCGRSVNSSSTYFPHAWNNLVHFGEACKRCTERGRTLNHLSGKDLPA